MFRFADLRVLWKRSSFLWHCCARIWKRPGNRYVCSSLLELACSYVRIRVPQLTWERALLKGFGGSTPELFSLLERDPKGFASSRDLG